MPNISPIAKGTVALLVSGGVIGGGTAYALWKSSPTIKDKLLALNNKRVLESDDKDFWEIKLSTYKKLKETDTEFILASETWETLKSWCATNSVKEFKDENEKVFRRVSKVCVLPTYEEKLAQENKELAGQSDWATKTSSYKGSDNNVTIKGISKTNTPENAIKDWCAEILKRNFEKNNENYPLMIKWCTKNGV